MSSLITNTSAMNALATLRNVNSNLATTQDRIGTGLKISSAKDNAAYFSISESMKGDRNMYAAIDEGLTLTKNSLSTARLGAEAFQELAEQFVERIGFAQTGKQTVEEVQKELDGIVKQMKTTIQQSTFNGDDFVNAKSASGIDITTGVAGQGVSADGVKDNAATADVDEEVAVRAFTAADDVKVSREVVTGISRAGDGFVATTMSIEQVDLSALLQDFTNLAASFATNASDKTALNKDNKVIGGGTQAQIDATTAGVTTLLKGNEEGILTTDAAAVQTTTKGAEYLKAVLKAAETTFGESVIASTSLGLSEKSIERQQEFLKNITATIDTGVGAMVDADMEEEAARLQALQVQQQLATQSLSIANEGPQNLLSLFR